MQDDDIKVVKTHASILIESLKPHGIVLKKSQALEVMSKLENRTDWNRLRAKLKSFLVYPEQQIEAEKMAEAFFIKGLRGRHKTETLKTLFELECADGVTSPILISVAGSGHTYRLEPDRFFSKIPRITVTYDSAGILSTTESTNLAGKGLLVNLVSSVRGSRVGAGLALAQFLKCERKLIGYGCGSPVGTLMVDDFDQITDEIEYREAAEAIRCFSNDHSCTFRRLVATAENETPKKLQSLFGMRFFHVASYLHMTLDVEEPDGVRWIAEHRKRNFEGELNEWKSRSLDDSSIVTDVCWWVWHTTDTHEFGRTWHNGDSRVSKVPGRSLWFQDLRASMVG